MTEENVDRVYKVLPRRPVFKSQLTTCRYITLAVLGRLRQVGFHLCLSRPMVLNVPPRFRRFPPINDLKGNSRFCEFLRGLLSQQYVHFRAYRHPLCISDLPF